MRKKFIVLAAVNALVLFYFWSINLGSLPSNEESPTLSRSWYYHFAIDKMAHPETEHTISNQFRADAKRTGVYTIELSRKIQPTVIRISEKINEAVHTASKSSPAVDSSGVYVGSDTGVMYAFDHSGKLKWKFKTDSDVRGIHGTAMLDENNIYFGSYSGFFYSLKKMDGSINWMSKLGNAVGASATYVKDMLIVSGEFDRFIDGHVVALEISTGKIIWKSEFLGEQIHASPTYDEQTNTIGVGSNNGDFRAIDIDTGLTSWKVNIKEPIKSTSTVIKDSYCFSAWDKKLHCLSTISGDSTFEFGFDGRSQSSPAVLDNNHIVVSSIDGFIYKVNLNNASEIVKFNLKAPNDTSNYGMPSPVVVKTAQDIFVVTTCQRSAVCFLNSDLKLIKKVEVGGFVNGTFTVYNKSIFGATLSNGVFRIDL